jgi:hypothetical protein
VTTQIGAGATAGPAAQEAALAARDGRLAAALVARASIAQPTLKATLGA